MKRLITTQLTSHSSFLTHPKEGSLMNTRLFSFIRRSALLVLALLVATADSASAQGDGGTYFDSLADQISIEYPPMSGETITVEAWVRFDGDNTQTADRYSVASTEGAFNHMQGGWDLAITPLGQIAFRGYWAINQNGSLKLVRNDAYAPVGTIALGQWHHIAAAATAGLQYPEPGNANPCATAGNVEYPYLTQVTLFVDGVEIGTFNSSSCAQLPLNMVQGSTAQIGGSSREAPGVFVGAIRDVRMWDVARSQADIAANMHNPPAPGGDLKGLYPLATVAVPDVVDDAVADGVAAIQAVGLTPLRADFAYTPDENLVGAIASTVPAAGEELGEGETVHYIEYRPSVVPDFAGQTPDEAISYLQAVGCSAQRADFAYTSEPDLVGKIHSTTPAAGEALEPGATVWYIEYRSQ